MPASSRRAVGTWDPARFAVTGSTYEAQTTIAVAAIGAVPARHDGAGRAAQARAGLKAALEKTAQPPWAYRRTTASSASKYTC